MTTKLSDLQVQRFSSCFYHMCALYWWGRCLTLPSFKAQAHRASTILSISVCCGSTWHGYWRRGFSFEGRNVTSPHISLAKPSAGKGQIHLGPRRRRTRSTGELHQAQLKRAKSISNCHLVSRFKEKRDIMTNHKNLFNKPLSQGCYFLSVTTRQSLWEVQGNASLNNRQRNPSLRNWSFVFWSY